MKYKVTVPETTFTVETDDDYNVKYDAMDRMRDMVPELDYTIEEVEDSEE